MTTPHDLQDALEYAYVFNSSGQIIKTLEGAVYGWGTTVGNSAEGWAPNALFVDTDATGGEGVYVNTGSSTTAVWDNLIQPSLATTGSSQVSWFEVSGTNAATYGSRHYNGNSLFSGAYMIGTGATHFDDNATGGAFAGYVAFIDVNGIKTSNNDVTAAFSGRVNITADQTLGDMVGSTLYLRNSAQALSGAGGNNLFACHLDYMYMGTGSATQSLRGHWIDVLEQATTPDAARDWIIYGTQVNAGAQSGGNITAFYCNMISSNLSTQLVTKGAWLRGSMKLGIDLSGITLKREATPTTSYGAAQIVLANVSSRPVSIFTYAGNPTGASTVGQHAGGSICIDTTNKRLYMNIGTHSSPNWDYVTNWT
jgi:hypothetical protein